jgi:AraC-like DNA-binding protein/tetratricopeptide (TPR) repeat protein
MDAFEPGSSSPQLLPRGVRRALEAMRADLERDWSIGELAAVAGVSARTLQRQFRVFFGKAPHLALRDLRFESARRALLQGVPEARVMDVALRCGLPHLGRFSTEYRRRFDETPSQTLKRQAVFTSTLAAVPMLFVPDRDRPSVAIGPIEAGPEHGESARCIADELAVALTRAGIAVVGRPRSARYHLTGAIRGTGRSARLIVRLIEAETGRHLLAHRSDGAPGDDNAPEAHVAARIAAAVQPCLRLAEIDRAGRKPDGALSPHDLTLRAMTGVLAFEAEANARALDLLERAIDRDPEDALALALAAWARMQRVVYHFTTNPIEERARGMALARRARPVAGDAMTLAVLGNAFTLLSDIEAADAVVRKALAVDGGSAWAWSRSGWIDVYRGDAQSAIERLKIALDLAPHDALAFNSLVGIGCAHFAAGQYLEAARWQERALAEHPTATWIHRTMCPAYVLGGAKSEATRSLAALRGRYPRMTVAEVQQNLPPLPQDYCDHIFEALLAVGLPA